MEALPRLSARCWNPSSRLAAGTAKVSRPTLPGYSDLPRCRWFGRGRSVNRPESRRWDGVLRAGGALKTHFAQHALVRRFVPGAHRRHVEPVEHVPATRARVDVADALRGLDQLPAVRPDEPRHAVDNHFR